ncbi:unnamed protein product [Orchesella dallaii]|uniref:F-box domain-containing protein n=1 Tax=Orchesella dallaii TaxID=48710 RepID=A0ABP1S8R2_9HEXA
MTTMEMEKLRAVASSPSHDAGNAESQSEGSVAQETIRDWSDKIPTEVLSMIFDKLVSFPAKRNGGTYTTWRQERNSLLNCRLVHSRWQAAMDTLLESKICMESWKKLEISCYDTVIHHAYDDLCDLQVISTKPESLMEWVLCPPSIYEASGSANPFPSKSLTVSHNTSGKLVESCQPMAVVKFFSQFGHHLTSLTLSSVSVGSETLRMVLGNTPHLKALRFDTVTIGIDPSEICSRSPTNSESSSSLPQLPHLEHMCIFYTDMPHEDSDDDSDDDTPHAYRYLYGWIVKPYIEQLVTLKTGSSFNYFPESLNSTPFNFEKLKRLSVWWIYDDFLKLENVNFPQLQYLCLGDVDLTQSLEDAQKWLARFASTLVELHLDVEDFTITLGIEERNRNTRYLQYSENQNAKAGLWSSTKTLFSQLTTFSIRYPSLPEEVEIVKDMIKHMPVLETLNFLRFNCDSERDDDEFIEEDKITAREHVEQEQYWTICPKLKRITVRMEVNKEGIFFSGRVADGGIIIA